MSGTLRRVKTRNVRRAQAQRYMRYLDGLTRRTMPRELRNVGVGDRYEHWWVYYGQFEVNGGAITVPWSVVYKLQGMRGRTYRW